MPSNVRPKKALGQHFLADANIAAKVASCLASDKDRKYILEIGPGTGMLTRFLIERFPDAWYGMEIDRESVLFLKTRFPGHTGRIFEGDFLKLDPDTLFGDHEFTVVGNFPYNISSQILFKVLSFRKRVPELAGMFQKEVAERVVSKPGSKVYGILSVLCQAFYEVSICFHIPPHVFVPAPKVMSSVVKMTRKEQYTLACDERLFFTVVKTAFNQRRKTLRNSLKSLGLQWDKLPSGLAGERPERLTVSDFEQITLAVPSS